MLRIVFVGLYWFEKEKFLIESQKEVQLIEQTITSLFNEIKYEKSLKPNEDLKFETGAKIEKTSDQIQKLEKGKSYKEIANLSINQTLTRTVLTSLTTLLTVVMLLVFGGGAVKDFALALFIGILVGTYSSIFVATPVVLLWHKEEKVK